MHQGKTPTSHLGWHSDESHLMPQNSKKYY